MVNRWVPYNPNPIPGNRVGDCTVRAISKATGNDWEETYAGLCACGYVMSDMPSADHVWGSYLRKNGFRRYIVDDHGKDSYTVRDFCVDNPEGVFILAITGHVVCVVDGFYYDTWDSGGEIPIYYWKSAKESSVRIWEYTDNELNELRSSCNFTRAELELFNYRSREYSLEDCADFMNLSTSTIKRVNAKMKAKIERVKNSWRA